MYFQIAADLVHTFPYANYKSKSVCLSQSVWVNHLSLSQPVTFSIHLKDAFLIIMGLGHLYFILPGIGIPVVEGASKRGNEKKLRFAKLNGGAKEIS